MSSTDKTRQKLMESMRKTKAGSASKSDTTTTKSDTKASSSASQSKPAAKPAAAKRKPAARKPAPKSGGDPYQAGRRVWPD
jgi:hypothetical protein